MTIRLYCAAILIAGVSMLPAWAHGPTPKRAEHQIEIAAAPDSVWNILRDPAKVAEWHPDIASVTMEGSGQGAKRAITFTSGGSVVDGIDRVDEEAMSIRWRLSEEDIDAFPVSFYTNDVRVEHLGDGSRIIWKASFYRADTTNEPEDRYSDKAAIEAMTRFIEHGLTGLKEHAGVLSH